MVVIVFKLFVLFEQNYSSGSLESTLCTVVKNFLKACVMNAVHLLIVLKITPEYTYTSLNAVYLLAVPEESLQSGTTKLSGISVLARPLASATPSRLWIPRAQRPKSEPGYAESGARELGCSSTSGQIVRGRT